MIGLYLLAAHLVGDFVLQTRWQAARKLVSYEHRFRHVCAYTIAFLPVAATADSPQRAVGFLLWLFLLHFVTDGRRFHSTLGDWIVWRSDRKTRSLRLSPNPWVPLPIIIDQTVHVAQVAILAGLFL